MRLVTAERFIEDGEYKHHAAQHLASADCSLGGSAASVAAAELGAVGRTTDDEFHNAQIVIGPKNWTTC